MTTLLLTRWPREGDVRFLHQLFPSPGYQAMWIGLLMAVGFVGAGWKGVAAMGALCLAMILLFNGIP